MPAVSFAFILVLPPGVLAAGAIRHMFTSPGLYKLLATACTSQSLCLCYARRRERSSVPGPCRPAPTGDPAAGPRPAALGQRDRRAVRHHPAGHLLAPEGAPGRGPGGCAPARPAAPVRGAARRARRAAGLPRRVLARAPATAQAGRGIR